MSLDPRTPVLVGAGSVQQRLDDPAAAAEPVELMIEALRRAAEDAGTTAVLAKADSVRVPRGFWEYSDPGRLIAARFGSKARTELAEIGVLQTTLFGRAVDAIAAGEESVALVAGGEAKYRSLRSQITGVASSSTTQLGVEPDRVLTPAREIWSPLEEQMGLLMPVNQYSMMENALRYAEGLGIEEHRRDLARLSADFSRVAAANPAAWSREERSADELRGGSASNRMLAFPYAKLHNSQWNVDQAAGLILTSVAKARELGIDDSRWVFPLAVAESNHMTPLSTRAEPHRSHGFRLAGERALALAERRIEQVEHFELYSCFPIAVRVQAREMRVPADRTLTVTGGMAFAGGPLNNFVLQALVRMSEILRRERGSTGMVTAVSGMLTKQGVSLWSTAPPRDPARFVDVGAEVASASQQLEVAPDHEGPATIAAYTVLYQGEAPSRAVVLCDLADGRRALAASDDAALAAAMTVEEWCGRTIALEHGHRFTQTVRG